MGRAGGWVPAPYRVRGRLFAGTTVRAEGTTGGVVFGEDLGHLGVELCEQALCGHVVAVLEVGELAGDGLEKESCDEVSAVGHLVDDVGEGAVVGLELDELCCGVDSVAGLEAGGVCGHGVDEELDDEPSALCLLADDVGE